MKKLSCVALLLALLVAALPALAETVALGTCTLTLPDTLEADALTEEDVESGMTAYYYNDAYDLALYAFDAEELTLSAYMELYSAEEGATQSGIVTLNGIEVSYYTYLTSDEEGEYYVINYTMIEDNVAYEVEFYVNNDDNLNAASAETAAVMETLTRAQ